MTLATQTTRGKQYIDGNEVSTTFNGFPLNLVRRRYSNCTFTWLKWWNGAEWVSAGDPWQSINIPRADLVALFGEPRLSKPDIVLASGRVVTHTRLQSGAWEAVPTTGPEELTNDEWSDYCERLLLSKRVRLPEETTIAQ